MATINQIEYLLKVKDKIQEPIVIIGSKMYDYDAKNIETVLRELGFVEIVGIDIVEGEGVHVIADACDLEHPYFMAKKDYFNTVICMELLTHLKYPWLVGKNINAITKENGHVIVSECFVRKFTRMPSDYWRFTFDGYAVLLDEFDFITTLSMKSLTRAKVPDLVPFDATIFEIMHDKTDDESKIGYYLRRIHRKFFGGKLFKVSRLLPEQTFYAIGKKRH